MAYISKISFKGKEYEIKDASAQRIITTVLNNGGSVRSAIVNANGNLIITLSNGDVVDAGKARDTSSGTAISKISFKDKEYEIKDTAARLAINSLINSNVQPVPNWDEHDSASPNYIFNRTHYKRFGTILPETTPTIEEYVDSYDAYVLPIPIDLIVGETYSVNWNGEVYECEAKKLWVNHADFGYMATTSIGNIGLMSPQFPITGEPFIIGIVPNYLVKSFGFQGLVRPLVQDDTYTFSILGDIYEKLDTNYLNLDNMPFVGREGRGQDSASFNIGTDASGYGAFAEGGLTIASGSYSHVEGFNTLASSDYQHVQGRNNISDIRDEYAHIVGNGESDQYRSNAHTLDWDGNAWFAGTIKVGGTGQNDRSAVEVALKSDLEGLGGGITDIPVATDYTLGGIKVGENLSVTEDGVLSVLTANEAESDNTRPITAAAVQTELGNISILLETI